MEAQRDAMVAGQLRARGIRSELVLAAMTTLPREEFVPSHQRRHAYEDRPLGIGDGQTISQPLVVASMTEALELTETDSVLEVGTGSGYQAAVLAMLCARVLTIERNPELASRAAQTLARLGISNVEVRVGDGSRGASEAAPFAAILVAAAAQHLPPELIDQLSVGGRLAIPVKEDLLLIRRTATGYSTRSLFPARFVPLIQD